ncbi:MAG: HD domain-containing protein [Pirellulaceae bacterium]|nr:HD domain-containing protein [Planctomycetales bacterium]
MTDISGPVAEIVETFRQRGGARYGTEAVSQLQHALQGATLARREGARPALVAAVLLHDIGHILPDVGGQMSPATNPQSLDDQHERRGYEWLRQHFAADVCEPVRLHVAAKRYLCTVDAGYVDQLSPTSRQSFYDQGGVMSQDERSEFESEPGFSDSLLVRRWDDMAKDPAMQTEALDSFLDDLRSSLL